MLLKISREVPLFELRRSTIFLIFAKIKYIAKTFLANYDSFVIRQNFFDKCNISSADEL